MQNLYPLPSTLPPHSSLHSDQPILYAYSLSHSWEGAGYQTLVLRLSNQAMGLISVPWVFSVVHRHLYNKTSSLMNIRDEFK